MSRDLGSGVLLIAGALAFGLVMLFHPTAHGMLAGDDLARQAHLNAVVHGVALAATPVLFLGLLGLTRRLAPSQLAVAALVAFGFGAVAVLSAAVMSGFVATEMVFRLAAAEGASRDLYHALLDFAGDLNQGYAKVYVVASALAILLWSAAILHSGRLARAAGAAGLLVGAGALVVFLSGHLRLDVHGFGALVFAQGAWLVWVGVLLCLGGGRPGAEPRTAPAP